MAEGKHIKDIKTSVGLPAEFTPYCPQPNEPYMSKGQKEHFRAILTSMKKNLLQQGDSILTEIKEADVLPDLNDRASQEEAVSLTLRTRERESNVIKKIEGSLDRLETNGYGYCENCDLEIGLKRLEARPIASLCIECKMLEEIREKTSL